MDDRAFQIAKNIALTLGKRELEKLQNKITAPFTNYAKDVQTYYRQSVQPTFEQISTGVQRGLQPKSQVQQPTSTLAGYVENITRTGQQGLIGLQENLPSGPGAMKATREMEQQRALGRPLTEQEKTDIGVSVYGQAYKDRAPGQIANVFNEAVTQPVWSKAKINIANIVNPSALGNFENVSSLEKGAFTGEKRLTLNDALGVKEQESPVYFQVNRFIDFIPELISPVGATMGLKALQKVGLVSKDIRGAEEALGFAGPRLSAEAETRLAREGSEISKYINSFKAQGGELTKQAEDFIKNQFKTFGDINNYVKERVGYKTAVDEGIEDLDKYIADQVKRSVPAEKSIFERGTGIVDWYKQNIEDSINPLRKLIKEAQKKGYKINMTNDVIAQIDRVKRAQIIANNFINENGLSKIIQSFDSKKGVDEFGEYVKAKRGLAEYADAPEGADYNKITGRDLEKDRELVSRLNEQYSARAEDFREYFRKLANVLREASVISERQYQGLIEKVDYAPLQRVFEEAELITGQFSGNSLANLSKENVIKRFTGSQRGIINPLFSAVDMTYRIIREAEVNKASRMVIDMVKEGVIPGTVARDADKVLRRIALAGEIKGVRKEINKLVRTITTRKGWAKKLQTEVNRLNRRGYDIFSRRKGEPEAYIDELAQNRIKKLFASKEKWFEVLLNEVYSDVSPLIDNFAREFFEKNPTKKQKIEFIKKMTTEQFNDLITPLVNLPYGQYKRFYNRVLKKNVELKELAQEIQNLRDGRELNQVVNNLINKDPEELQNIRSLLDKKTPILNKLVDEISNFTDNLQQNKDYVKSLREESTSLKDLNTKFQGTISGLKDGIKETVILERSVADALKGLSVEKLNTINKILRSSIRVAKFSFTGGNIPFVIADMLRNELGTVIWSKRGIRDSLVNPVNLFQTLFDVINKSGTYQDFLRQGGGETIANAGKDASQTVEGIRAGRNALSKASYVITNPGQWFSMIEDALSSPQALQKFNFYRVYRKQLEKSGVGAEEADYLATVKTREVLTNFYRSGDIGKVLDSVFVYFNAGVQGAVSLRRLILQNPGKFAVGFVTYLAVPEIVSTLWNVSTPERKDAYDKIPEADKERNFIILPETPIYDEKGNPWALRIPKPLGLNNLINPVRKFTLGTYQYDSTTALDIANELVGTTTSFKAPSPTGGVSPSASQIVPWLARGSLETALNKNIYTGRDIETADMRRLPVSERVEPDTSFTSRQISKTLTDAGLEISPIMVDNFISSQFGAVGRQVQNTLDTGAVGLGVAPEQQIGGKGVLESAWEVFWKASGGEDIRKLNERQVQEAQQKALNKLLLERALSSGDVNKANELIPNLTKQEFENLLDSMQKDILKEKLTNMQRYLLNRSKSELEALEKSSPELANDIDKVRETNLIIKNTTLPVVDQLQLNFKPSSRGGGGLGTTAKKLRIASGRGRKASIKKPRTQRLKGIKVKKTNLKRVRQPKIKPIKVKRKV